MRRILAVTSIAAASLAVGLGTTVGPAHAALPTGFSDVTIANPSSNPLSSPTGITPLDGGRALITEKAGAVRVLLPDGTIAAADALSLSVCANSEEGLLGAAVDPAFAVNGYVYLYYTRNAGNCNSSTGRYNRVSRFTMSGNTINPASELILLDNMNIPAGNHNGGDLHVGQDGYLYVTVGDGGTNPRLTGPSAAQDLSLLNGKIMRITTSGGVPADNPLVGVPNAQSCATTGIAAATTAKCTEIYDWGLRNPFRFAFDPNTGSTHFFINDVGQGTWEEVDEGGKGLNYGWDIREGFCANGSTTNCGSTPAGYTDPLTSYNHNIGCTFITAGAFVPNGIWPAEYDNSYLFADGGCGKMWQRTAAGAVDYNTPFAQTSGTIVAMAFVTQGSSTSLFYVTNGSSQLHQISYAPAAVTSGALAYTSLASANRVYDTRDGTGVAAGAVRAGSTRSVDLKIADSSVKAALVNLTMVQPIGQGFLQAWQAGTQQPATSNINAGNGEFVANASIVPVDSTGKILIYSSVTTDVVIDVMGTFKQIAASDPGGRFTTLSPARLVDTRVAASATNAFTRADAGQTSTVNAPVTGKLGVPSGVSAVALIVTAVSNPGTVAGYVTAYAHGAPIPPTSNLNQNGDGDVRPNLVVVPVGADGSVDFKMFNTSHVVVDVAGYFSNTTSSSGLYHTIAPTRIVDTRTPLGFGSLGLGATQSIDPGAGVPNTARAVSENVTMTQTLGGGFLTAFPADEARPTASNGNATAPGQDRASLALTKVGAAGAGSISYYSSGGTDLVVDITGYFDS